MKGFKNVVTGIALSAAMAFCLTGCSEAELKQIGAAVDARIDERIEAALSERDALNAENEDIQYVLFLGTNDKDTNEPVFTPEEAKEKASLFSETDSAEADYIPYRYEITDEFNSVVERI